MEIGKREPAAPALPPVGTGVGGHGAGSGVLVRLPWLVSGLFMDDGQRPAEACASPTVPLDRAGRGPDLASAPLASLCRCSGGQAQRHRCLGWEVQTGDPAGSRGCGRFCWASQLTGVLYLKKLKSRFSK